MSIPFIDVSVAVSGVCFTGSGRGCDSGVCVSIFSGGADGDGVAAGWGICMSCCAGTCGLAEGDAAGVGITWVSAGWGDDAGAGEVTGDGMTIPGVCSCPAGIGVFVGLIDSAGVADFRLADFLLTVRIGFRFLVAAGFGLGLLVPGIEWPSCCANTPWEKENESENNTINAANKNKCLDNKNIFFMIPDFA